MANNTKIGKVYIEKDTHSCCDLPKITEKVNIKIAKSTEVHIV